jgi:hypothetical protein
MILRKLSQSLRITLALMVATFSSGLLQPAVAYATRPTTPPGQNQGQETCPNSTDDATFALTGGWVKTDDIDALTWDIPEEIGYTVTDVCYKASTSVMYPDPITDPVVSTVTNDNDELQNISHVSVYYTKNVVTSVPVTPAVYTAPTCDAPGTLIGTDTEDYTFVRTGADTAAVLTATPVGDVTLTGTLMFGPYDLTQLTGERCEDDQITVSPVAPTVTDVCGTNGDSVMKPQDSEQITYSLTGNVVTATLVNPTTHDFGAPLNGYVVAENGLTATYTATFPNDRPCLTPSVCETPTNGGVITQNTAGWTIYGDTEFVEDGLELSSNGWSGSYIKNTASYMISDALELGWTVEGTVDGASGTAIIFKTAGGANIHYEPEPYSDDFWTNTAGILPANAGGQGGSYSGSLQDLLNTGGDQSIVATYFYFNSATENTIVLKSLSFNCTTYTFDKEVEEEEKFVFVCKYVGQPGIDERLQTGQNPIRVSVNAIPEGAEVGAYFADAQGRSFVLAFDTTAPGPAGDPDVSECPMNPVLEADIDVAVVCVPNGVKVTLTNSGDASGMATVNGTVHTVAAGESKEVVLAFDLGTPFMTEVTVTVDGVTSTQTVNCTPGQGGNGGQTLGTSTTSGGQTLGAAVLPAVLPSTGATDSPVMILAAALLAYGAAYFLQGRRLVARRETIGA